MNQIVIALERRRLIQRSPSQTHGRTMCARLTAKGAQLLAACDEATLRVEQHLLAALSPVELETLHRVLSSCVRSLGKAAEFDEAVGT